MKDLRFLPFRGHLTSEPLIKLEFMQNGTARKTLTDTKFDNQTSIKTTRKHTKIHVDLHINATIVHISNNYMDVLIVGSIEIILKTQILSL